MKVKPINLCTLCYVLVLQVNDQSRRSAIGSFAGVGEVSGDLTAAPVGGEGVVFHLDLMTGLYSGIKGSQKAI